MGDRVSNHVVRLGVMALVTAVGVVVTGNIAADAEQGARTASVDFRAAALGSRCCNPWE